MYKVCSRENHYMSASPYYRMTVPIENFQKGKYSYYKICSYCRDREDRDREIKQLGVCKSSSHRLSGSPYKKDEVPLVYMMSSKNKLLTYCSFCRKRDQEIHSKTREDRYKRRRIFVISQFGTLPPTQEPELSPTMIPVPLSSLQSKESEPPFEDYLL